MKNKIAKVAWVFAVHTSGGLFLFWMDNREDPGFLNIQKWKQEVFKTVTGFGYFDSEQGKLMLFD